MSTPKEMSFRKFVRKWKSFQNKNFHVELQKYCRITVPHILTLCC